MRISRLVLAEITGRPLNFVLSLMVVVIAAILFIAGPTIISGYAEDTKQQLQTLQTETDSQLAAMQQETDQQLTEMQAETDKKLAEMDTKTKRIMRDLGVNLRIVHRDTQMGNFYTDFTAVDFPEDYVQKLATAPSVETIVHLVATLQEKIKWNGRTVLLVGMLPVLTASQKNAERKHMAQPVEPGTVVVGFELAAGLSGGDLGTSDADKNGKLDPGEELDVLGTKFTVAEIRPEAGSLEDIQLIMNLHDAQTLVEKPGRVHQIMALNCKCHGSRISVIRKELEGVLPDTKVTEHLSRATAREMQRDLVEQQAAEQLNLVKVNREQLMKGVQENRQQLLSSVQANREHGERTLKSLVAILLPIEVLVAGLIVGLMTWLNVRERRSEIGLLRALGKRTGQIASLFLIKAAVIGLLGGFVASLVCVLAYAAVLNSSGTLSSQVDLALFQPTTALLLLTVVGAPVVTAMASYLPMLLAVSQDPARVLTEQ